MIGVIFFSNQENQKIVKSNEFSVNETITTTTDTNDSYIPEPISSSKFVIVVFETEEPSLYYRPRIQSIVPGQQDLEELYWVSWTPNLTVSKVLEFDTFTTDDAYMLMDETEKFATVVPEHFKQDVNSKIYKYTERENLLTNKNKVIKRSYLTFDTYAEASIKRQELLKPKTE